MSPLQSIFAILVLFAIGASFTLWIVAIRRRLAGRTILAARDLPPVNWYPETLVLILGLWFGIHIIIGRLGLFGEPGAPAEADLVRLAQLTCFINGVLIVAIPCILRWLGDQRPEDFGMSVHNLPDDLRIGGLTFIAALVPVYTILLISLPWRTEQDQHAFLRLLENDPSLPTVAWVAASAVIFAPLAEELLYRVVLQGWLESRMRPTFAIALAAVMFAGAHGPADAWALLPLAILLGYVYHRRRSFWAIALAHSAFNTFNLTAKLITGA